MQPTTPPGELTREEAIATIYECSRSLRDVVRDTDLPRHLQRRLITLIKQTEEMARQINAYERRFGNVHPDHK